MASATSSTEGAKRGAELDVLTRARMAAAAAPNVTITDDNLMEEGWLAAYSEEYNRLHHDENSRFGVLSRVSPDTLPVGVDACANAHYAKNANAWQPGQVWHGKGGGERVDRVIE
jgi:hypothetical protein